MLFLLPSLRTVWKRPDSEEGYTLDSYFTVSHYNNTKFGKNAQAHLPSVTNFRRVEQTPSQSVNRLWNWLLFWWMERKTCCLSVFLSEGTKPNEQTERTLSKRTELKSFWCSFWNQTSETLKTLKYLSFSSVSCSPHVPYCQNKQ